MKLEKERRVHNMVTMLAMGAIIVLVCIILTIFYVSISHAESADDLQPNAWILRRMTADNVLIRKDPSDTDYVYTKLVDNDPPVGAGLILTGEKHGRWLECVCIYIPNRPTGWVREEFVVADRPEQSGRVATVIRPVEVGGYSLVKGDRVKVLYRTDARCTTIWGFVQTDSLDFSVTGEVTQPRRAWPDWTRLDHLINIVDWW